MVLEDLNIFRYVLSKELMDRKLFAHVNSEAVKSFLNSEIINVKAAHCKVKGVGSV